MRTARARTLETDDDGTDAAIVPAAAPPMSIAMFGSGSAAAVWAPALRGVDGVRVEHVSTSELSEAIGRADLDALCFTEPSGDLTSAIRRALLARKHVLVGVPTALASRELRDIDGLAVRRNCVVMLDTPDLADEHVAFVRRMIGGRDNGRAQAMWRPRYVRALRTGQSMATLPETAISEIAAMIALAGGTPARVSALAPTPDDQTGCAGAAMLSLSFEDGLVSRVDVSLIEAERRRETVVACADRTVTIEDDGRATTMRMVTSAQAAALRRSPWSETVIESPRIAQPSHASAVANAFVRAARERDTRANNAAALGAASQVWDAARASLARAGGSVDVLGAASVTTSRQSLQLIRGGGRRATDASTPELTLVARSEPPPRSA